MNLKLFMDADCLIKISKAGFKDLVVQNSSVFIPEIVQIETVDAGLAKKLPDAFIIRENIKAKKISLVKSKKQYSQGDLALIDLFNKKKYDAVATDDAKLIKFLQAQDIPYILPGVIIYKLYQDKKVTQKKCQELLEKLKPFISPDEYSTIKILLEK